MSAGKRKFIEDAARVIDGRVAVLKQELARSELDPESVGISGDRAAIAEAELLAKMIRKLALKPYRDDPYEVAYKRWSSGKVAGDE